MADSAFWRSIGEQFGRIDDVQENVWASWVQVVGLEDQTVCWEVRSKIEDDPAVYTFKQLAALGGKQIEGPLADACENWLHYLRSKYPVHREIFTKNVEGREIRSGELLQLCRKSREHCGLLDLQEQANELIASRLRTARNKAAREPSAEARMKSLRDELDGHSAILRQAHHGYEVPVVQFTTIKRTIQEVCGILHLEETFQFYGKAPALLAQILRFRNKLQLAIDETSENEIEASAEETKSLDTAPVSPSKRAPVKRIPRAVTSLSAAKRLHDFLQGPMGPAQFSEKSGLGEKTIYTARTKGKAERRTWEIIAQTMGTTPEELLSDQDR